MGAPATDVGHRVEPPTVTSALDRMVDAAQQVVVDQVRLARLEALASLTNTARDGALIGAGAIVLLLAWVFAMIALQGLLSRYVDDPAAGYGIIAAANAVIGAALVIVGRSRSGGAQENAHGAA